MFLRMLAVLGAVGAIGPHAGLGVSHYHAWLTGIGLNFETGIISEFLLLAFVMRTSYTLCLPPPLYFVLCGINLWIIKF